jgi:hypothetical protein
MTGGGAHLEEVFIKELFIFCGAEHGKNYGKGKYIKYSASVGNK